jgi:hypothetical protein
VFLSNLVDHRGGEREALFRLQYSLLVWFTRMVVLLRCWNYKARPLESIHSSLDYSNTQKKNFPPRVTYDSYVGFSDSGRMPNVGTQNLILDPTDHS